MSTAPARFPRSGWLAVGVAGAAAANAAGVPAPRADGGRLRRAGRRPGGARPSPSGHEWPRPPSGSAPCSWAHGCSPGPAQPLPLPLPDDAGPWTAVVESVGSPRDGAQVARLRLTTGSGEVVVAATLPAFPPVAAGDVVEVDGRLRPPPDDDPYGDYLRRSGAAGTLDARVLTIREAAPAGLQSLRDASGDALQLALPEPEAGLAAGILVGLRERVDRSLAADFATAGVEPRRRDLGLEHRDRRGPRRGGAARTSASPRDAGDPRHGRGVRRRGRRVAVRGSRGGHGGRRPARPGERAGWPGTDGARARGGDAADRRARDDR